MAAADQLDDVEPGLTRPVRPSLAVLQDDQRALIRDVELDRYEDEHYLRAGYPERRHVIGWFQRAIVRTFGHIADERDVSTLAVDDTFVSAMVVGEERSRWRPDPMPFEQAARVREMFEARMLLPACNAAYNDLRLVAGEYIDDDDGRAWTDLDPEQQKFIAMRPAFRRLDAEQHNALKSLWGGFESREGLFNWLHGLDDPTNGAIRSDIAALVDRSEKGIKFLLNAPRDGEEAAKAREVRELFAITFLLPAFVQGVKRMSAGELAARPSSPLEARQG